MAPRTNPAGAQAKREKLKHEIEEGEAPVLGMMPLAPGDLKSIFGLLRTFKRKFPAQAGGLIGRVAKMLKATPEEMATRTTIKARNHWGAYAEDAPGTAARQVTPPRETYDLESGGGGGGGRAKPDIHLTPAPQGPNNRRAAQAAEKLAAKIVDQTKAALKNAPKE